MEIFNIKMISNFPSSLSANVLRATEHVIPFIAENLRFFPAFCKRNSARIPNVWLRAGSGIYMRLQQQTEEWVTSKIENVLFE